MDSNPNSHMWTIQHTLCLVNHYKLQDLGNKVHFTPHACCLWLPQFHCSHCTSVCDRQERKMVSFSLHSCMCACVCPHPPEHPIHSPAWPASGFWWMYWSSGGWGPPQSCRPTHLKGTPYKVTSTALARCEHTSSRMRVHVDSGNNYWPPMDSHAHTCTHVYIWYY